MFFHFNHYYALFAGISSALIGVKEIRDYIEQTLSRYHTVIATELEPHILEAKNLCIQFEAIIKGCVKDDNYLTAGLFISLLNERKEKIETLKKRKFKIDVHSELKTISKKLSSLHIYVFLFSVLMLLVSAFTESNILSSRNAFAFVGTFEIIALFTILLFSFFIKENNKNSILIISICCFGIGLGYAIVSTSLQLGAFNYKELVIVITSLIICASPLIVLICTCYLKWTIISLNTNSILKKHQLELSNEAKKVTDYILTSAIRA